MGLSSVPGCLSGASRYLRDFQESFRGSQRLRGFEQFQGDPEEFQRVSEAFQEILGVSWGSNRSIQRFTIPLLTLQVVLRVFQGPQEGSRGSRKESQGIQKGLRNVSGDLRESFGDLRGF